jgi:hypothetical protein
MNVCKRKICTKEGLNNKQHRVNVTCTNYETRKSLSLSLSLPLTLNFMQRKMLIFRLCGPCTLILPPHSFYSRIIIMKKRYFAYFRVRKKFFTNRITHNMCTTAIMMSRAKKKRRKKFLMCFSNIFFALSDK